MSQPQEIIDFWFGAPGSSTCGQPRQIWFESTPEFDEEIRRRFVADHEAAAAGRLDHWKEDPLSCLALVLLLDQVPRNLFRDDARAYTTDAKALEVAQHAVARGYDGQVLPVLRWFLYLPFEHSEDPEVQRRSLELWESLRGEPFCEEAIEYAHRHARVIERFGRFPHRNANLGRPSTPEEEEFLAGANDPF